MYTFKSYDNVFYNAYSGLVSLIEKKQENQNLLNELSLNRYKNKERMCTMDMIYKKVKTINIHPVGRTCYGSCMYCYNTYYPYTSFSDGYLTEEMLDSFLKELKEKELLSDNVLFKFTGGSCFLYDNLYKLFNVIKKYIKNVNLRFHADLMYPENVYQNVLQLFDKLNNDMDICSVKMYITTDYGSDTRYAKHINIRSQDIIRRAEEIVSLFGCYQKFQIELKTNINFYTDEKILISSFEKMVDKNCWLVYNPVRHEQYSPSVNQLQNIINLLDNIFETKIVYKREKIIKTKYFKKMEQINKRDLSLYTIYNKIDENIYLYFPFYFDCPGYTISTGISPNGYIPCFIGYFNEKNLEDSMKMTKNNKDYYNFFNNPTECTTCEYLGICMRCMLRKHILPCSIQPSLKLWEKYIWECKIKERYNYWIDNELKPITFKG